MREIEMPPLPPHEKWVPPPGIHERAHEEVITISDRAAWFIYGFCACGGFFLPLLAWLWRS